MGMDGVELVMAIEEAFGCSIPDAATEKMLTPRDVIDWLVAEQERGGFFTPSTRNASQSGWLWRVTAILPYEKPLERRWYSRDEIRDAVFVIIREQLGVDKVWEDARFIEDFGIS